MWHPRGASCRLQIAQKAQSERSDCETTIERLVVHLAGWVTVRDVRRKQVSDSELQGGFPPPPFRQNLDACLFCVPQGKNSLMGIEGDISNLQKI